MAAGGALAGGALTGSPAGSVTTNDVTTAETTTAATRTTTGTEHVEDVSGPCDEAEHADDRRCTGGPVLDDD